MQHYINYGPGVGVTINTYRQADGYYNDDVRGLVDDMRHDRAGCCPLAGARAALQDGSLWADADREALETLHATVVEFELEEGQS